MWGQFLSLRCLCEVSCNRPELGSTTSPVFLGRGLDFSELQLPLLQARVVAAVRDFCQAPARGSSSRLRKRGILVSLGLCSPRPPLCLLVFLWWFPVLTNSTLEAFVLTCLFLGYLCGPLLGD